MASGPDMDRLGPLARRPRGRSLVRDQRGATIIEFAAVVTTIGMLTSMFGLIYVLTGGGPGTSTTVPEFLIWLEQGKMNRPGYASAISMVLFLMMAGLAAIQIRIMSRNADI